MLFRVTYVTYFAFAGESRPSITSLVHTLAFTFSVLAGVCVGASTARVMVSTCGAYAGRVKCVYRCGRRYACG